MHKSSSFPFILNLALVTTLMGSCGQYKRDPVRQHDGVNNGGDPLKLLTLQGKILAIDIVRAFSPDNLNGQSTPEVTDWIMENQEYLVKDVNNSPHLWSGKDQETCAQTKLTKEAPIEFSHPVCNISIHNLEQAVRVLLHESVHHFGITDEEFCDHVALALVASWKNASRDFELQPRNPDDFPPPPMANIRVVGDHQVINQLTVNLEIEPNESVRYFKVSKTPDFLDQRWLEITDTFTVEFTSDGQKVLYYKVTNGYNLESSPFSIHFNIDLFSENSTPFIPQAKLVKSTLTYPELTFELIDFTHHPRATHIALSDNPLDFEGRWQELTKTHHFTLNKESMEETCADHSIFFKYRDADGFDSEMGEVFGSIKCPNLRF